MQNSSPKKIQIKQYFSNDNFGIDKKRKHIQLRQIKFDELNIMETLSNVT